MSNQSLRRGIARGVSSSRQDEAVTTKDREQLERIRERFTRTAQSFAQFALGARGEEAERLARMAVPGLRDAAGAVAIDLACGPGTFTRAFAARVRFLAGLDFTPAMLSQARDAVARAGLGNVAFARADVSALPFADSALELGVCAYSFHHFLDPARTLCELSRVLRPGGRVALVDIIVPEGADSELNNRIERTRDPSHARTLTAGEFTALLEAARFRPMASETSERVRKFDDWMQIMGLPPGASGYAETRYLMEASMPGDTAGFRPRFVDAGTAGAAAASGVGLAPSGEVASGAKREIEFVQTSLFVVAEKR